MSTNTTVDDIASLAEMRQMGVPMWEIKRRLQIDTQGYDDLCDEAHRQGYNLAVDPEKELCATTPQIRASSESPGRSDHEIRPAPPPTEPGPRLGSLPPEKLTQRQRVLKYAAEGLGFAAIGEKMPTPTGHMMSYNAVQSHFRTAISRGEIRSISLRYHPEVAAYFAGHTYLIPHDAPPQDAVQPVTPDDPPGEPEQERPAAPVDESSEPDADSSSPDQEPEPPETDDSPESPDDSSTSGLADFINSDEVRTFLGDIKRLTDMRVEMARLEGWKEGVEAMLAGRMKSDG